jgi:superfamily II DNA/RNA helicase
VRSERCRKIANLPRYRQLLAPHVKRRLVCEPDVARYIQIDPPVTEIVSTDWHPAHLALYLKAADDFADWYRDVRRRDGKANNLVTILARIRAVHSSANYPQHGVDGIGCYAGITSKQQAVIDRLNPQAIAAEGKQAILFAEYPGVIELIKRELGMRGVETVPFHGGIPIKRRVADNDKRFLRGTATGLLCTKASGRAGYNLPNADYVLFYDRSWTRRCGVHCDGIERDLKDPLFPPARQHRSLPRPDGGAQAGRDPGRIGLGHAGARGRDVPAHGHVTRPVC